MLLRLPYGVKDEMPEDIYQRKEIEDIAFGMFERWGYLPVSPPTFEYYDTLALGAGDRLKKQMYRFIDRDGELLSLRAEFTTPIARMVANKFSSFVPPMRFFYFGKVYRFFPEGIHHKREFYQLGAELVGVDVPFGEIEILNIFIALLKELLGNEDFFVDVSHAGFIRGILDRAFKDPFNREKVKSALSKKRFVLLEEILDGAPLTSDEKALLLRLPTYRGNGNMLREVESGDFPGDSIRAIKELNRLVEFFKPLGNMINVDLSLTRGIDYYTGIVFEAFSCKKGLPLGGGGRYDNLIKNLGADYPAIGFALDLESVKRFVRARVNDIRKQGVVLNLSGDGSLDTLLDVAERIREKGIVVDITYFASGGELDKYVEFRHPACTLNFLRNIVEVRYKDSIEKIQEDRIYEWIGKL
ncbi:MAG: ATP phosphoribosyltransferase regulatory subunit [Synergistetes bacterium]|nr:ATP phosphoribosyltransferase regulatory subunit [Synergistota bacterium]